MPTAKKQPTVESLMTPRKILSWVRNQPTDSSWNYNSPFHCLLACYLKDKNAQDFFGVGGDYVRTREVGRADIKVPIPERVSFGLDTAIDKYGYITQEAAVNGFRASAYGHTR